MARMLTRVQPGLRALQQRVGRRDGHGPGRREQILTLQQRVADLEDEVMENRQLARRIAELTDVVEQLLLSPSAREELRADRDRHAREDATTPAPGSG